MTFRTLIRIYSPIKKELSIIFFSLLVSLIIALLFFKIILYKYNIDIKSTLRPLIIIFKVLKRY